MYRVCVRSFAGFCRVLFFAFALEIVKGLCPKFLFFLFFRFFCSTYCSGILDRNCLGGRRGWGLGVLGVGGGAGWLGWGWGGVWEGVRGLAGVAGFPFLTVKDEGFLYELLVMNHIRFLGILAVRV